LFPSDQNSYRHYMEHHLFRHVNIDIRNTHPAKWDGGQPR
jgi:hypothetical protein